MWKLQCYSQNFTTFYYCNRERKYNTVVCDEEKLLPQRLSLLSSKHWGFFIHLRLKFTSQLTIKVVQISSTTVTNKNRLTPHTDQKWRHDLALYLSLLQSYMCRARFILNSGEHEVLIFIQFIYSGHSDIYKPQS